MATVGARIAPCALPCGTFTGLQVRSRYQRPWCSRLTAHVSDPGADGSPAAQQRKDATVAEESVSYLQRQTRYHPTWRALRCALRSDGKVRHLPLHLPWATSGFSWRWPKLILHLWDLRLAPRMAAPTAHRWCGAKCETLPLLKGQRPVLLCPALLHAFWRFAGFTVSEPYLRNAQ